MGSYEIGKQIKKIRESHGHTQETVADVLNMSRQRYMRIENGKVDISYSILQAIAQFFSVGVKELTRAQQNQRKSLQILYREKSDTKTAMDNVEKIEHLLNTVFAHEKLYYETHGDGKDDL